MKAKHAASVAAVATAAALTVWTAAQVEARAPGVIDDSTDDFWETVDEQGGNFVGAGADVGGNVGDVGKEIGEAFDDNDVPSPPEEAE